jgi:hypothetical protein
MGALSFIIDACYVRVGKSVVAITFYHSGISKERRVYKVKTPLKKKNK